MASLNRRTFCVCSVLCAIAACAAKQSPQALELPEPQPRNTAVRARAVAPYYYLGWGDPPDVRAVMRATGVKWFSLAFMIDGGSCEPRWDAERPLDDARDVALVKAIRAQAGDVMVSFGGQQGPTLELHCPSSTALAAAYRKVITAYQLTTIDIDLEGTSYRDAETQQRVVDALLELRAHDPALAIYITLATGPGGPDTALIERAARAGLMINGWSIMTFDWSDTSDRQAALTMAASDHLKDSLMRAYGLNEREAYQHSGISTMNGRSDENGVVTLDDMRAITAYAKQHDLARLSFWAVNRDRPCPEIATAIDRCSSTAQENWAYTRAISAMLEDGAR